MESKEIDCDDPTFTKLKFDSLQSGFDVATAMAVLKIVCGYSQHWENYYNSTGKQDAADAAIREGSVNELHHNMGCSLGAGIVRDSIIDDWNIFVSKRNSHGI